MVTPPPLTAGSFVSVAQLCLITTLSEITLWRLTRRGELPKPITICGNRKAWPAEPIVAWLDQRRQAIR